MKKDYKVRFLTNGWTDIKVTAESEEEAYALADEIYCSGEYDDDCTGFENVGCEITEFDNNQIKAAIETLKREIPNISEFYDDKRLTEILEKISQSDDIVEDFMYEICDEPIRRCDHCGRLMKEGYCIDAGMEYYCSDECLHEHYTDEEWKELYDDGNSESYWTEWE